MSYPYENQTGISTTMQAPKNSTAIINVIVGGFGLIGIPLMLLFIIRS